MSKLFLSTSSKASKAYSQKALNGTLQKVCKGVWTDDLEASASDIVRAQWVTILPHILPGAILSHRTASELMPCDDILYITGRSRRNILLPGLTIKMVAGDTNRYTETVSPGLKRSNVARRCLENIQQSRTVSGNIRSPGIEYVEIELTNYCRTYGEEALKDLRKEISLVDSDLGFRGHKVLDRIIGVILATRPDHGILKTPQAKALSANTPYDDRRVTELSMLKAYLDKITFIDRPLITQRSAWRNEAFFESYFSNYIEGTEFQIDEAENIIFSNQLITDRFQDSHDILTIFQMTSDMDTMMTPPKTQDELVSVLCERHAFIMKARPNLSPGKLKTKFNKVGNTTFVAPKEVEGTLKKGFSLYIDLAEGIERAIFMHYLVAIVHPFSDGNGRMARIMMNSELAASGSSKIIIPTVMRDNYINGLINASRRRNFRTMIKVFDTAQAFTSHINWVDYGSARESLDHAGAFDLPDESIQQFYRFTRDLEKTPIKYD